MNISVVELQDFKCFEKLELPCASLTVLTGYNAAGKSSVLHSLLLMAQAARSNLQADCLALNGDLVNLGSAGDVIRHGSGSHSIRLGFRGKSERITWTFGYERGLSARGLMSLRNVEYKNPLLSETCTHRLLPGPGASKSELLRALQATVYMGPERSMQAATYPVPRAAWQARGDVGVKGEHAAYWYLECADDAVDVARRYGRDKDARQTVRSQVEAWMDELFPNARVNADRLTPEASVQLTFRLRSDGWVSPANVGYGLGYGFPMLISMLTAEIDSVIVIDSAEAHLHPRAQSAVGRFLGQMAGAGLQIFVETHSDHLLNGIRIAVRDRFLAPEDVALHFFDLGADSGQATSLDVDRNGAISDWPKGFFDQAERDLSILSGWD